ncbi:ABC transporter permease [Nocardioides sp. W7]|uniref:ABC transporter permease n=1 Tax=Nocardioides sp. W7 TaxID=2931390 RepID=UPI001FD3C693|nr:ABC transporter permease [Nocardioides sp. W7]
MTQTTQAMSPPLVTSAEPTRPVDETSRRAGWRRWTIRPVLWGATLFLLVGLLAAVFPATLTDVDPLAISPIDALRGPSLAHPFGTDQSGRDVFARVVHGARDSLTIALLSTLIATVLGMALGLGAGLGGRRTDAVISRVIEVLFAFPSLLLALLVLTVFGNSVTTTTIAVGVALSPGLARLVRGEALVVRESGYVEAERLFGRPRWRIIAATIAPNVLRPLMSYALLNVGGALIWSMTLSFFGFGARGPAPEWGAMLADGQEFLIYCWWLPVSVGLAVILTAASATVLGRHLQSRLAGRNQT